MAAKMKRFLCMLMAVLMIASTPISVFAENGTNAVETNAEKTLQETLAAATNGETVSLEKDTVETVVMVPEGVTLDLNGCALEAKYVTCYGNIVDTSADNAGLLKVSEKSLLIQETNEQLPVKTEEGYRFFEVIKFNTTYDEAASKFVFQPFVEKGAHEFIKAGTSGVTINVKISWTQNQGTRSQNFVYNEDLVEAVLNSYNSSTNKYGKVFTLTLKSTDEFKDLTFTAVVASNTKVEKVSEPITINKSEEEPVVPPTEQPGTTNGELDEDVTLDIEQASAFLAEGTKVNGETLALTTEEMSETTTDVNLAAGEEMLSLNVHVDGVAKDNTVPVLITINEIAPEFLNQGNITLYHVENGETVEMTRVYSLEEVDAHNEFYYDILTGTITMALASFSEIAVVSEDAVWEGNYDYSWYTNAVAPVAEGEAVYKIANADQLAAFGAIVGGMDGQTRNDFAGKTVKLLADINLGDDEKNNKSNIIFYPIGYYNSTGSYEKVSGGSVTSNVYSFRGTFDGNGHTISNFYQNTWEMFGGYNDGYSGTPNHYKTAMGLFGYVNGGTVKNLNVSHFSSDGEFTPTGVIAAYATNATFENIAITNCNPRVYNTGNGGIVGIGGNTDDPDTYKLTFNNITIDNSNIISALWGSWDVACGGLVGMFRGAGHAYMTNCHVAAQIDVYNDVCGNYQYYWYRYSGMMIGTNKNMVTDKDGYTVPETSKFHAENCTVHFGDWNNYYYCELVANSLASYTHDHQFSRLTEVDSIDVENMTITVGKETTAIPTSGRQNYVVVNGEPATENATCYHFVDGAVWNHEDAGKEMVNGVEVLKEDNQHIYLPFNQLFTGYGWGVKHIPVYNGANYAFEGITILDRTEANSLVKFGKATTAKETYETECEVTIGELFKAVTIIDPKLSIKAENVQVTVSAVGDESTATGTYVADTSDWTKGTLTFAGVGKATVTITDYYFCTPTTIDVMVKDYETVTKFATKVADGTSYVTESKVTIGDLFEAATIENPKLAIKSKAIQVTVSAVSDESTATGTYVADTSDWTKGTVTFGGIGTVTITITDEYYCIPTTLTVMIKDYDPVQKFAEADTVKDSYETETVVTIGELFKAVDVENLKFKIKPEGIQVTVSAVSDESTATGTYVADPSDWTKGTLTFAGEGTVTITITDEYYCTPTTITVTVKKPEIIDKFVVAFDYDTKEDGKQNGLSEYTYRVGNAPSSPVALATLFEAIPGVKINDVKIEIINLKGNASGQYTKETDWKKSTIQFSGNGFVEVKITADKANTLTLKLEVVDGVNATSPMSATSNNVVLLKTCDFSTITVSNGYTLYGNGFKLEAKNDVMYDTMGVGFVTLQNGTLDNVQVVCPNFSYPIIYNSNIKDSANPSKPSDYLSNDARGNVRSAVMADGNCKIINSYIHGGRAAIYFRSGNLLVDGSTISGGAAANMHVLSARSLTLRDVTLIQKPFEDNVHNTGNTLMGFSGLFQCDGEGNSTPLILEGTLIQSAWVNEEHKKYVPSEASSIVADALKKDSFMHNIDGKKWLNLGFTYIPLEAGGKRNPNVTDNRTNKDIVPYESVAVGSDLAGATVYSYKATDKVAEGFVVEDDYRYIPTEQGFVTPTISFGDTNEDRVFETYFDTTDNRWESCLTVKLDNGDYEFDFSNLLIQKYGEKFENIDVNTHDGSPVNKTQKINLTTPCVSEYILTVKEGDVTHTYNFILVATKTSIPEPELVENGLGNPLLVVTSKDGDWSCALPALENTKIKYYTTANKAVNLNLAELSFSKTGKQNGTNNYLELNGTDYKLKVTCGYIHEGYQVYGMPVVVNNNGNKLYFTISSDNGMVGTGTAARSVTLTYEFTDPNGKTLKFEKAFYVERQTYLNNSGKQYSYSEFVKGNLKEASCVTADTLITLADGSQVRVDSLAGNEELLVWNLETGKMDSAPIMFVDSEEESEYEIIHLYFSDGTDVKVIYEHGFWDYNLNKYVYLDSNAVDYIGHEFAKQDGNGLSRVTLTDVVLEKEVTTAWSPVTENHLCYFVNGMLSMPGGVGGLFNIFDVDAETMTYDFEAMANDIETYGLFTYEELNSIEPLSEDMFNAAGGAYLKVSIGKGNMTMDDLVYMIQRYSKYFD